MYICRIRFVGSVLVRTRVVGSGASILVTPALARSGSMYPRPTYSPLLVAFSTNWSVQRASSEVAGSPSDQSIPSRILNVHSNVPSPLSFRSQDSA